MIDLDLGFLRSWRKALMWPLPRCFDTSSSWTEFNERRARYTQERTRAHRHKVNSRRGGGGGGGGVSGGGG